MDNLSSLQKRLKGKIKRAKDAEQLYTVLCAWDFYDSIETLIDNGQAAEAAQIIQTGMSALAETKDEWELNNVLRNAIFHDYIEKLIDNGQAAEAAQIIQTGMCALAEIKNPLTLKSVLCPWDLYPNIEKLIDNGQAAKVAQVFKTCVMALAEIENAETLNDLFPREGFNITVKKLIDNGQADQVAEFFNAGMITLAKIENGEELKYLFPCERFNVSVQMLIENGQADQVAEFFNVGMTSLAEIESARELNNVLCSKKNFNASIQKLAEKGQNVEGILSPALEQLTDFMATGTDDALAMAQDFLTNSKKEKVLAKMLPPEKLQGFYQEIVKTTALQAQQENAKAIVVVEKSCPSITRFEKNMANIFGAVKPEPTLSEKIEGFLANAGLTVADLKPQQGGSLGYSNIS